MIFQNPMMKHLCLTVLAVLAISFTANDVGAQEWTRKMFKKFSHDFGTVAKHAKTEYRFQIHNPFNEDITIARAETSCRCTDVSLTKTTLKSGETGEVVAKFNTDAFEGFRQATLTIRFAAPFVGEAQLLVKGNIRPDVLFQPGEIQFNEVNRKSLTEIPVTISFKGNPNWRIVDIRSTFNHIGVNLSSPTRTPDNRIVYTMNAKLKDTVPSGFQQGELLIIGNDRGQTQEVPIKFTAKVVSDLQVSPDVVTISSIKEGEQVKKKLVLKGTAPFKIVDVTCANQCFVVEADTDAVKKVHFVDVIYSADQPPGRHECKMEFVTDLNEKTIGVVKAIVEVSPKE